MPWRRWRFERWYRSGAAPWDTGITPPEVVQIVEGPDPPTGRALDLGCGTGTNVRYLAEHGLEVVGVDFSVLAIAQARTKLDGVPGVEVFEGDVSRLDTLPLEGPFRFVLDIGCFHGLTRSQRAGYARGVAVVTGPGALLMIFAWPRRGLSALHTGVTRAEMQRRFAPAFTLDREIPGTDPPGAAWYLLRRGS